MTVKYLLSTSFVLLTACSSHSGRAPIYDATSTPKPYVATGQSITPGQTTYIVEKGDTLYSIAWRAKMNVNTLIKRNNLKKPYIIRQGEVLKLKNNTEKASTVSQNKQKTSSNSCATQSCQQNSKVKVVKKSTKAYPAKVVDKKVTKKPVSQPVAKKVSDWRWPSEGKLIKTFANSTQGMKGISIANDRGSSIYAAANGQVVYAGSGLRGYGNLVIIKHNYDYLSAYAHNDKLLVKENEQVKMGQKIAVMGDSGTDSVYLHFDIRYRGKSVDPLRYLPKR
ncbi:peptidoglycan DD-metalloendopeptidase family protein [Psychromonas sp. 14N.309.X.WAT.B.A12]|uniref:peptidoglycan DD-metalloendopeptidase family protein n=1 Tax=unclassified Psychromonas TaxID=2614957 RepID=UPI0025AFB898|nr:peptidoglycan DD-metalloendopeptidase family protein [Psychromonas sp. 14N.309.X.WAT.B.A12]MDN2663839.1 peptidoglycan DD-metalloendopeptidase family protein [Psychromonas sp. 14N.309.X.WAT.B.A12]